MKRVFTALAALFILLQFVTPMQAEALNFSPTFELQSQSALLVNLDTDLVLYEKNADTEQMPAQLVNIMTAIICLESCTSIATTTITADGSLYDAFSAYAYPSDLRYADIQSGDVLSVQDLLYAMMLTSSCEAAVILADYFGDGNMSMFVTEMNLKAQSIGATNTVFANPHGLYDSTQVTTARDMALIAEYALNYVPGFRTIATAASWTPPTAANVPERDWNWTHSNLMMSSTGGYYYEGASGIKTGNLQMSGRNILTIASREGNNYLVVLLNAPIYNAEGVSQYFHLEEAAALFDWVFDTFTYTELLSVTEEIAELPVTNASGDEYVLLKPAEDFVMLWPSTMDINTVQRIRITNENVIAPIQKGDILGKIELKLSGETLATVDLVADRNVERSFVKYNMSVAAKFPQSKWMKTALRVSIILTVLYFVVCIYAYVAFRRKPKPVKGIRTARETGKKVTRK